MPVGTIFVLHIPENEITITAIERHVAIIRILAIDVHDRHARNRAMENPDLFEEGTGEIHIDSVGETVPFVAPPLTQLIDRKLGIFVIHRDDLLAGKVASTMVQVEEITKHETPLAATCRTFHRVRNIQRLIEFPLLCEEIEANATVCTYVLHQ
jgi:hypothetical protein